MNSELWNKILVYSSRIEESIYAKIYMPKKVIQKKSMQVFILNIFLEKWSNNPCEDPVDILDGMLLYYINLENNVKSKKIQLLTEMYSVYIKTLTNVRKIIIKEIR